MKKNCVTAILLFAGAAFIVTGVAFGQPASVMAKAVKICLECVGIG